MPSICCWFNPERKFAGVESTHHHDVRNDIFDVWDENHWQLIPKNETSAISTLSQARR